MIAVLTMTHEYNIYRRTEVLYSVQCAARKIVRNENVDVLYSIYWCRLPFPSICTPIVVEKTRHWSFIWQNVTT